MPATENDRNQLDSFLRSVSELLQFAIQDGEYVSRQTGSQLFAVWETVDGPQIFRFESEMPNLNDSLEFVGLSGHQLRAKVAGYRRALETFSKVGGRKLLLLVLEWANVILGSLGRVMPGLEPLLELKGGVETAVREREDLGSVYDPRFIQNGYNFSDRFGLGEDWDR
jgi:hypothetical protein